MLDYLIDHQEDIEVKTDLYLWATQIAYGDKAFYLMLIVGPIILIGRRIYRDGLYAGLSD